MAFLAAAFIGGLPPALLHSVEVRRSRQPSPKTARPPVWDTPRIQLRGWILLGVLMTSRDRCPARNPDAGLRPAQRQHPLRAGPRQPRGPQSTPGFPRPDLGPSPAPTYRPFGGPWRTAARHTLQPTPP